VTKIGVWIVLLLKTELIGWNITERGVMNRRTRKQEINGKWFLAFTLIELLVVIAIIAFWPRYCCQG